MTFTNQILSRCFIALMGCLFVATSYSHERFIVPTHTMLSGDKAQAVTLTASISNDIFHPDRPLGDSNTGTDVGNLKSLFELLQHSVISPTGEQSFDTKWRAFARMSVADVEISESGTYRIGLVQPDVHMTTFKKADGTPWRLFGEAPELPAGAKDIVRRTTASRVETFVSLNTTTDAAVKPVGNGVELGGESHPNDLFAGEQVNFQLFYNGQPAKSGATVKLIKAGTRHRNDRNEQVLVVDDSGKFSFTPEQAGFYFLGAEVTVNVPQPAKIDVQHFSLYLTLEVFPE